MRELNELASLAANGDAAALEELLTRIRPEVVRRCSRILPHLADAEDAAQESLIAVVRGIGGFRGESRFTTWLYPVVANTAFATYRKLRRVAVESGLDGVEVTDPIRVSVVAGTRLDLVEALEQLRAEQPLLAQAVVLRDLMGLEYQEIADQVNVPLGTVKSRINHGRQAIRGRLTR
jgi:RNA polymerase sigma-70 factor (ECF subfamily)